VIGRSYIKRKKIYFKLDNSSSDSSINNIAVTANSLTYGVNEFNQSNSAGSFNGTSTRINFNNTTDDFFKTNFSFIYWIKPTSSSTFYRPFNSDSGGASNTAPWFRTSLASSQYYFGIGSNDFNIGITGGTVDTNWNSFGGICSGNGTTSNIEAFVNGSSIGTASGTHRNINSNKYVSIGVLRYQPSTYLNYYSGLMDNIIAYDIAIPKGALKILNNEKGRIGLPKKLLLDNYSGSAVAYSLRKLRYNYSGSAIRVRRASDNAEQDIGFVSNELDTTSLASFCSGTNGFVTTWYDQSGNNRNATQSTTANQPKIYDSSTGVLLENGKPTLQFDGSNDSLGLGTAITKPARYSIFQTLKASATGVTYNVSGSVASSGAALTGWGGFRFNTSNKNSTYWGDGSSYRIYETSSTSQDTNQNIYNILYDSGLNIYIYKNNSSLTLNLVGGSATTSAGTTYGYSIGLIGELTSGYFNGNIQEHIIYTSYEGANVNGINTNINSYYGVY